jgi:hypothetical protein
VLFNITANIYKTFQIVKQGVILLFLHRTKIQNMALPLRDIVKQLIIKAGLDVTDAKFADLLSSNSQIDDSVGTPLLDYVNSSMSLESAKNSPALEVHFKGKTLSPMESELENLMSEYGLDDASKAELKLEKSTYKKVGALTKKIADLQAAKVGASSGDKKALQDEINKLNQSILTAKTDFEAQVAKVKQDAENEILDFAVTSELSAKTYSEAIPEAIRLNGANELLRSKLAEKNLKAVRDGKNIKLVYSDKPDLVYMEDNKAVNFSDFATSAVRPMLKVSDVTPQGNTQPTNRIITDSKTNKGLKSVSDFNLQQAENFAKNSAHA